MSGLQKEEAALKLNAASLPQSRGATFDLKLGSAENLGGETKSVIVTVSNALENKASSKQTGPIAKWNGETVRINILNESSPVTIQLKDANTDKDILTVVYSLFDLRMKSNGQNLQITQNLGGPFIIAKFEIAENNLQNITTRIKILTNEIDRDV